MRKTYFSAAMYATCLLSGWLLTSQALAADPVACDCDAPAVNCECSGGADGCPAGVCGLFAGHPHWHGGYEGQDLYFNCGCNGSYKFPVPPLYTYFWPGMYSQELMTDYHYPKRFPPLKPYTDEPDPVRVSVSDLSPTFQPVSSTSATRQASRPTGVVPMSERMLRQYR